MELFLTTVMRNVTKRGWINRQFTCEIYAYVQLLYLVCYLRRRFTVDAPLSGELEVVLWFWFDSLLVFPYFLWWHMKRWPRELGLRGSGTAIVGVLPKSIFIPIRRNNFIDNNINEINNSQTAEYHQTTTDIMACMLIIQFNTQNTQWR